MSENNGIIIDLDRFIRAKYLPPSSHHPVNQIMGGFVISSMKLYAVSFYHKEKPNLNEYRLLQMMKREYPNEKEEEYDYALHRARTIYNEFKREYQTGLIHGVPSPVKTVNIYNDIFIKGKPTLIAKNAREVYIIKTFPIRALSDMPDLFSQAVGMSFLYPSYRIWLIGFAARTGQIQSKIVDISREDRNKFIEELKEYVGDIK